MGVVGDAVVGVVVGVVTGIVGVTGVVGGVVGGGRVGLPSLTYNSINSIGESSVSSCWHILASMLSVVGLGSCLMKYGGLLNEQQVLMLLKHP